MLQNDSAWKPIRVRQHRKVTVILKHFFWVKFMRKLNSGSWILVKEPNEIEKFIMQDGKTVCEVYESFSPEKVWANANLITSAPDLLEALEGMISLFPEGVEDDGSSRIGFTENLKKKYRAAVKAIAKAKVESQ